MADTSMIQDLYSTEHVKLFIINYVTLRRTVEEQLTGLLQPYNSRVCSSRSFSALQLLKASLEGRKMQGQSAYLDVGL